MSQGVERPPGAELPLWRKALPFVVGGGLIAFVLARMDLEAFLRAVRSTRYVAFMGFVVAFSAALLCADGVASTHVYRRTVGPVRLRDVIVIRAASYLPSMLNHHVGQGWLTYFLSRTHQAPLWRVAGATLLVYATTFGALLVFGLLALPLNHDRIRWLAPTVGAITVAGAVYLAVILVKPAIFRRREATAPLMEAGVRGHLIALALRIPHVAVLFGGTWGLFGFFGVHVPLGDAFALIPPLMVVTALPITPQGVGTRDAIAIELLSGYATGTAAERSAAVAAATLSWACALTLVQACISPLFMRKAHALLGARRAEARPG